MNADILERPIQDNTKMRLFVPGIGTDAPYYSLDRVEFAKGESRAMPLVFNAGGGLFSPAFELLISRKADEVVCHRRPQDHSEPSGRVPTGPSGKSACSSGCNVIEAVVIIRICGRLINEGV